MRDRDPSLPEKMSGGIRNPLGAKALYLGNSLYRIHGTNDASRSARRLRRDASACSTAMWSICPPREGRHVVTVVKPLPTRA